MNIPQAQRMESIFDGRTEDIYSRAEEATQETGNKKPLHIVNNTPLEFAATTSTALSTTTELAMQINEVFKPLFSDWHGCDVLVDEAGRLVVNFVFRAVTGVDDAKRAFLPINQTLDKSQNKTMNRIVQINALNNASSRRLEMTKYGAEMIYDVLNRAARQGRNPFDPKSFLKLTGEIYENAGYNNSIQNIYCTVMGIDINKILGLLFGTKDEKEGQIIYGLTPKRPVVAGQMPGARTNFIVEIQKMTMRKFNEAMTRLGAVPMPGAITAITETVSETYPR